MHTCGHVCVHMYRCGLGLVWVLVVGLGVGVGVSGGVGASLVGSFVLGLGQVRFGWFVRSFVLSFVRQFVCSLLRVFLCSFVVRLLVCWCGLVCFALF